MLQYHWVLNQGKWLADDLVGNVTVSWDSTYTLAFVCTKEPKPREFQFKLPYRRIATKDFLHKIGIKQSDSCTFCGEATENLVHLFRGCKYSKAFWKDCLSMDNAKHLQSRKIQPLLFGLINDTEDLLLHHLVLIASIIFTPVNKEIRAQMSKCTYK